MELSNKIIWQQSCGDTDRNCADICFRWDVILTVRDMLDRIPNAPKS